MQGKSSLHAVQFLLLRDDCPRTQLEQRWERSELVDGRIGANTQELVSEQVESSKTQARERGGQRLELVVRATEVAQ